MKRSIALILVLGLLLSACGKDTPAAPADPVQSENLMENIKKGQVLAGEEGADSLALTDFGLRLFQQSLKEGENTLISPLSVLYALSMTANGARGDTLAQMEAVLGQSVGELNGFAYNYRTGEELQIANGIWFRDKPGLSVEADFLQTNADFYRAGIYKAPFDDTTLKDINGFVEENTGGLIRNMLSEIPEEAVMYLVNALAFDAQWTVTYQDYQVQEDVFTTESGAERKVELMHSQESRYLVGELAEGFLKPYKDSRYAFAALLPYEDVSVSQYVQNLTSEALQEMLSNPRSEMVTVAIPKFESEFDVEMSEILKAMGMEQAFEMEHADFSGLGTSSDGNIHISQVLHKTSIKVAEQGTKAGAATVVVAADGCAAIGEPNSVILNRPFVYMIVDTQTNMPVFMGTVMDVGDPIGPDGDHSHEPAMEPVVIGDPTIGYCGNMQTMVYLNGEEYTIVYDDSVKLTDLLISLDYDSNAVCRCMADFTVDTEFEQDFEVSLGQAFVRCGRGQAPLTGAQVQTIRDIINKL